MASPVTEEHHVCPARALSVYLSDLGKADLFCVLQCHSQPLVPWKKTPAWVLRYVLFKIPDVTPSGAVGGREEASDGHH